MSSPALKTTTPEAPAPRPHAVPTASPAPQQVTPGQQTAPKAASPMRKLILGAAALVALAVAGKYGYEYATVGRFMVSTDDAYVKADTSVLSTKVAGLVAETPVLNNTPVKAGTVLLRLDTQDYELAIADAKAKIATQQAGIAVIGKQKAAQEAQIASAQAQAQVAKAGELNAVLTQQRSSQMVKSNVGSQQALDDANRARDVAEAGITQADAGIQAAVAQLAVLDANEAQAQAVLANLNVALEKAHHDMDSAEIKAPFDGVVANRAVAPGEFVGPGTNLMALVPLQTSFITANFKETQLPSIHAGQKVEIDVDAFKGEHFAGKVASLSPASGAEFSLLPPDNATGNFTKITQRFPVKILLPPELSAKLRPGMSVAVSVDSRDSGEAAN
jgi:membrane fusion protein (multidrug efflux system)